MCENNDNSLDILGIKPISKSIDTLTKGVVEGASAFLGRICLPAAEEFGYLVKDKISNWRARNAVNIATKAQYIMESNGTIEGKQAHPRIVSDIMNVGSWVEVDDVQDMWAGLLASSCEPSGKDDSNLVFINILNQLTTAQARFVNYICLTAEKQLSFDNFIYATRIQISVEQLSKLWETEDIHRIDRELDQLRNLGLIEGGFPLATQEVLYPLVANITPSPVVLHLYVRCQGSHDSPGEFFKCVLPEIK